MNPIDRFDREGGFRRKPEPHRPSQRPLPLSIESLARELDRRGAALGISDGDALRLVLPPSVLKFERLRMTDSVSAHAPTLRTLRDAYDRDAHLGPVIRTEPGTPPSPEANPQAPPLGLRELAAEIASRCATISLSADGRPELAFDGDDRERWALLWRSFAHHAGTISPIIRAFARYHQPEEVSS